METKKIAVACFIGGAVCAAVAFMVVPIFWWLGLIAGIAGGYISYEFREVCETIPIAWQAVRKRNTKAWKSFILFLEELRVVLLAMIMIIGLGAMFPILVLAFIGSRIGEKCFWRPLLFDLFADEMATKMEKRGFRQEPFTYRNVARWTVKGLGITILFFVWTIWKYLAISIWKTLCFLPRFSWQLVKLIHSHERVLCAIDGTLGGAISYGWFSWTHAGSASFAEYIMLVIFGGLLGVAIGVANWEIVSKRILRVAPIATK